MTPIEKDRKSATPGLSSDRPAGKSRVRERLTVSLRDLIVEGGLKGGQKLNELELSRRLKTSRTPLREALLQLEREGLVRSDLRRGFSVEPLSAREIRESYPVLCALECLAVRSSIVFVPQLLPKLGRINAQFARARSPQRALDLDTLWHDTLMSQSKNARLAAIVANLRRAIRRYEILYMSDRSLTAHSVRQHRTIIAAFRRGDMEDAIAALGENYRFGMQALLRNMNEE
jgi:DNA-binding GntR family transcriptional regulator